MKKKEKNQVEEVTGLEAGKAKFRKGDELYYLLKKLKKSGKDSTNLEDILRIDLTIEGESRIKAIPIELGGVRSFLLDKKFKEDDEDETNMGFEAIEEEKD